MAKRDTGEVRQKRTQARGGRAGGGQAYLPGGEVVLSDGGRPVRRDAIDKALVQEAVDDLNQIYSTRALDTACMIGEYVVERFFDGRIDAVRRNAPGRASFHALTKRADLKCSKTYLWTAVAVVSQLKVLPDEVGNALHLSHHRLLLPIKNPNLKVALARRALARGLSKRQLAREIALFRKRPPRKASASPGSRHPRHSIPGLLRASESFIQAATSAAADLDETKAVCARSVLRRVEADLDAVQCVLNMLHQRLRPAGGTRPAISPGKRSASSRRNRPG